jgi:hypothetical protein
MLKKVPKTKSYIGRTLKIGIALETIAFLGTAVGWYHVNHDRGNRLF